MIKKVVTLISIGVLLTGCGCVQPYQRLYILADESAKLEMDMAAQCMPDEKVTVDLD